MPSERGLCIQSGRAPDVAVSDARRSDPDEEEAMHLRRSDPHKEEAMHLQNWVFEEDPGEDDDLAAELFEVPEIKSYLVAGRPHDDDFGLRSLLARPEALSFRRDGLRDRTLRA